ncbi:MAG: sigma-70 family RNA polymerase sigma factor [Planctomycetota bacterium]
MNGYRSEFRGTTTCDKLIGGLKATDPTSWENFARVYSPLVYAWCRRSQLSEHDAADVVQEVFRSVYRGMTQFQRHQSGSFRGWLRTITTNKIRDHHRQSLRIGLPKGGSSAATRLLRIPDLIATDSQARESEDLELVTRTALQVAESEVEPRTWQAFSRVVMDGQAAVLVAEQMGMSVGAVYTLKSRILRRIRELIDAG